MAAADARKGRPILSVDDGEPLSDAHHDLILRRSGVGAAGGGSADTVFSDPLPRLVGSRMIDPSRVVDRHPVVAEPTVHG